MLNQESLLLNFLNRAAKGEPIKGLVDQAMEALYPEWLTEKEAAEYLRCSTENVRRLWKNGHLSGKCTNPWSKKPRVIYNRNSLLLFESNHKSERPKVRRTRWT